MKLRTIFGKIWNDNVWGAVISSGMCTLISVVLGVISSKHERIKNFFLQSIPVYCLVIIGLFSFFVILFMGFRLKKIKQNCILKENANNQLIKEMNDLQSEINELKKEPDNPRMSLFINGDVVIIKGSDAYYNIVEYTVVGKTSDSIIVVDKEGNKKNISPDALLTPSEYHAESEKQKRAYDALLNHNTSRRNIDPFSYI